jgi:D-glycero-alpha-D-manno-heptose-7-phosphate kinase
MTLIRAKAPLRLGLAGGGTDVSPYSDIHGGAILNVCINMYAYATIIPNDSGQICLEAIDRNESVTFASAPYLEINGYLDLLKGVYNRLVKDFKLPENLSFKLQTYVDAPAGSGLGSSSTLVVAIIKAFSEWLNLPLGEYDIAHLAFEIERIDLAQAGGKQDQYAATFGGVNFMEFYADDKVIVNPLKIKDSYLSELEQNLVLYYTGTSRLSSKIIEAQRQNVQAKNASSIDAMHELKLQAQGMKEAILRGELSKIGQLLDFGWQNKKKMAIGISNEMIDAIYEASLHAGATGGKISGAGGGGFMMFYCPINTRYKVIETLENFGGKVFPVNFASQGASSWRTK